MLTAVGRPHAIVLGAGLGGLAAAIRLGARGYRVTVLEKLGRPGGRAGLIRQHGFTFDTGPTIVTAPFVLKELWDLAGRRFADDVELVPLDPFYEIRFDDGSTYCARSDPEAMRAEVARLSPSDVVGYEKFMAESAAIYKVGFQQLAHVPFTTFMDMVRTLPSLLKLKAWRSVHAHVATHVRNPKLRMALSFHPLFIGGNPFRATAIYSMIAHLERAHGVFWVKGGTHALIEAMVKLIEWQGNRLRLNATVSRIRHEDGRATGAELGSGEFVGADVVVSNACTVNTYSTLLADLPVRPALRDLKSSRHSMSLFVWYFGVRGKFDGVAHHTILMGPRYRELIADIFDRRILAEDMSLYLHRPTATDSSVAPAGCDAFYALSPVPNLGANINWETAALGYKQRIADRLHQTILPDFQSRIITEEVVTPRDFQTMYDSHLGAAFGLEPVLTQSAWFRPHNKGAGLKNFYLVGAGTHPGAGIPGVLSSARVLDSLVPGTEEFADA